MTTDLIILALEFGAGRQWPDEGGACTALCEFLEENMFPEFGTITITNCVYMVWHFVEQIDAPDVADLRQELVELTSELGCAAPDKFLFPHGFIDSIGKVTSQRFINALFEATKCKRGDQERYSHLVPALALAGLDIISADDAARLTATKIEQIQAALAHGPTVHAIDREAIAMKLDGRAARAAAAVGQFEIVERLRAIARDPSAAPSAVIAAANTLRDLTKGASVAASGISNNLPAYSIDAGPRRG